MTVNEALSAQISELRWLVYELGHEMQTLETTSRPYVHQFLMHGLAAKIAQVAETTCSSLADSLPTSLVEGPVSLVVAESHHVPVFSRQKGHEIA